MDACYTELAKRLNVLDAINMWLQRTNLTDDFDPICSLNPDDLDTPTKRQHVYDVFIADYTRRGLRRTGSKCISLDKNVTLAQIEHYLRCLENNYENDAQPRSKL